MHGAKKMNGADVKLPGDIVLMLSYMFSNAPVDKTSSFFSSQDCWQLFAILELAKFGVSKETGAE